MNGEQHPTPNIQHPTSNGADAETIDLFEALARVGWQLGKANNSAIGFAGFAREKKHGSAMRSADLFRFDLLSLRDEVNRLIERFDRDEITVDAPDLPEAPEASEAPQYPVVGYFENK